MAFMERAAGMVLPSKHQIALNRWVARLSLELLLGCWDWVSLPALPSHWLHCPRSMSWHLSGDEAGGAGFGIKDFVAGSQDLPVLQADFDLLQVAC